MRVACDLQRLTDSGDGLRPFPPLLRFVFECNRSIAENGGF